MAITFVIYSLLVCVALAAPRYPSGKRTVAGCRPQGTPKFGHKWCSFEKHQAEVGSICWFSCRDGYHLKGTAVTECIIDPVRNVPRYNTTFGHCLPDAPMLRQGKNGPFLLHSYDPSSFVIHVDFTTAVTLKSYYYLAFYVQSPGLNGVKDTVSFGVEGYDSRYIKANDTAVYVDDMMFDDSSELDKATFRIRKGQFYEGYSTFESYSKKDHFIIHKSRKIQLSKIKSEEDRLLASFIWSPDL